MCNSDDVFNNAFRSQEPCQLFRFDVFVISYVIMACFCNNGVLRRSICRITIRCKARRKGQTAIRPSSMSFVIIINNSIYHNNIMCAYADTLLIWLDYAMLWFDGYLYNTYSRQIIINVQSLIIHQSIRTRDNNTILFYNTATVVRRYLSLSTCHHCIIL